MNTKAQPIAYTTKEGGVWQPWPHPDPRPLVFAIKFADGWVIAPIVGWRKPNG